MRIRNFQLGNVEVEGDTKSVIDLWHRCELVTDRNYPLADIQRKMEFQPDLFFVAEVDGRVIGSVMAGYDGHRGWINYLAVDPECAGKGLGKALMLFAEAELKSIGCPKINLQVRESNQSVAAFYEGLGYELEDRLDFGKSI